MTGAHQHGRPDVARATICDMGASKWFSRCVPSHDMRQGRIQMAFQTCQKRESRRTAAGTAAVGAAGNTGAGPPCGIIMSFFCLPLLDPSSEMLLRNKKRSGGLARRNLSGPCRCASHHRLRDSRAWRAQGPLWHSSGVRPDGGPLAIGLPAVAVVSGAPQARRPPPGSSAVRWGDSP